MKLVTVWLEGGENIDLPVLYTVAHLHANESSFSTAIETLRACACVRVLGQDRGKASLWFLSQQLQSQLVLSQPHVVFSPSLSTAARASKYLLYCTQAGRWRVGGWVGGGGVNVPGTFANH